MKFKAEGQEFAKSLRSLKQFIQTVKGQNNIWIGALVLFQKLFLPFNLRINCFRDLKDFANSWPSTLNFKSLSLSRSLELFFITVGQNNFGNKIPFFSFLKK